MANPAWRLEIHDVLGSTSDVCFARAEAGEADGLAVLARTQTRARGSRGRDWQSPPGNLALSVLLRDAGPVADVGWMPLMTGVALIEALSPFVDAPARLTLKWPNDVNLDGAKLAGILVETKSSGAGVDTLVLGIGVNLAMAPEVPGRRIAALVHGPSPEAFAACLLARLLSWRSRPREAVRAAWLAHGHAVGTTLQAIVAGAAVMGAFAGLDPAGRLLLGSPTGIRAVGAGEVLLHPAA